MSMQQKKKVKDLVQKIKNAQKQKDLKIIYITYGEVNKYSLWTQGITNCAAYLLENAKTDPGYILLMNIVKMEAPFDEQGQEKRVLQPIFQARKADRDFFNVSSGDQWSVKEEYEERVIWIDEKDSNGDFKQGKATRKKMISYWGLAEEAAKNIMLTLFNDRKNLLRSNFSTVNPWDLHQEIYSLIFDHRCTEMGQMNRILSHHTWRYDPTKYYSENIRHLEQLIESMKETRELFFSGYNKDASSSDSLSPADAFVQTLQWEKVILVLARLQDCQEESIQTLVASARWENINDKLKDMKSGKITPEQVFMDIESIVKTYQSSNPPSTQGKAKSSLGKRKKGTDDQKTGTRKHQKITGFFDKYPQNFKYWCVLCHFNHPFKKCYAKDDYIKTGELSERVQNKRKRAAEKWPENETKLWSNNSLDGDRKLRRTVKFINKGSGKSAATVATKVEKELASISSKIDKFTAQNSGGGESENSGEKTQESAKMSLTYDKKLNSWVNNEGVPVNISTKEDKA